jgi:RNA polymerase sigma-70 factor (ECF subfamily)
VERTGDEEDLGDVRLAAAGDAAAFERLYRRHAARVYTLARRLLGPARAEDATQEVFLRAWRRLATFRDEGPFGAWVHRLARNLMIDEMALARRDESLIGLDDPAVEPAAQGSPPDVAVDLDAAIDRLPAKARQVLALRHFLGCSHEEIALLLGISAGTSKSQLHRARSLLAASLEGGDRRGRT